MDNCLGDNEFISVPLTDGQLLVFGNYQLTHRLMNKMMTDCNNQRSYLAFFVVDQMHPLQSTANRAGNFKAPIPRLSAHSDSDDDDSDNGSELS